MRIAVFTDTYRPEINGVVTSIDLFRRELEGLGHTVYLFCPRYFDRKDPQPNVFRFPSTPYLFSMMTERRFAYPSLSVMRQVARLKPDIIHSQVPANIGVFGLIAGRLHHIPHVHTYHTLFMQYTHYMPFPHSVSQYAVGWISRHFCGRCQRVVSPSHKIRDEICSYGVDAPIDVIPTGIDIHDPTQFADPMSIRRKYGIPGHTRILSMVGRIGREKNISFLLRVVKLLKSRHRDFVFIIAGDGPDKKPLQGEVQALGLDDDVIFTGYIQRNDVFALLRATDVFTFASITETQGLVLLEAMSMGTPVVAVDEMGVADLMADGLGGLTAPLEEGEFAAQVERLLSDDGLRTRITEEALAKAREWSIEHTAKKLVRCYERAIADYRRNGQPRFGKRARTELTSET